VSGEHDRHAVGEGEEVTPHPARPRWSKRGLRSALSPEGGKGFFGRAPPRARMCATVAAQKDLPPSPRGEGGPRQAFSPAVAGRMRGYVRALDHELPATHNRGFGRNKTAWIVKKPILKTWVANALGFMYATRPIAHPSTVENLRFCAFG
jgi:hypothetical protein